MVDDLLGGWTNRYADELKHRRTSVVYRPAVWAEPWITAWLWTSEPQTPAKVREELLTCIHRTAYIQLHGAARSLGALLEQEGQAMAMAGVAEPKLDNDDIAYTRIVLEPFLAENGEPTLIAALFGDGAARELGYTPLGLSARAGLALALADATSSRRNATRI
ncbi:MAG: hypothetical protein HC802_02250 [Caldilineaceae bacterium]|nr:hypothetical protein [Caldilineaceae bacterium]